METYVVRIWRPATAEPAGLNSLRGLVQRIGSDEEKPFADEAQLLAILGATPAPLER